VISAARDGCEVAHFRGEAAGVILREARGGMGFGYDPLFYVHGLGKSFAELTPIEKARVSHRGDALRKFLEWARLGE
jgi:XTP/dITP diphosphohydrolase